MLMDLSKDIMMDLGITVVGDIIAILKHAKVVYRQVRQLTKPELIIYPDETATKVIFKVK